MFVGFLVLTLSFKKDHQFEKIIKRRTSFEEKPSWGKKLKIRKFRSRNTDPYGDVLYAANPFLNQNIRLRGEAFMCLCWIGGINDIEGCNYLYNMAVSNNWMSQNCSIISWEWMGSISKAKTIRFGDSISTPKNNEKVIVEYLCCGERNKYYVENKFGKVEYNPIRAEKDKIPSTITRKIFYGY